MNFADNLRVIRTKSLMTRKEMAEKIGVSLSTYTNYEAGNRSPSIELLPKIAAALNVTTDQLLGYSLTDLNREKGLAAHSGLAVEEQGGCLKVDVSPDMLAKFNSYELAMISKLDLSPVSPADFVKSVKIGRQLVIDKYPQEFILQILMGIDYRNNPPPGSEEYEAKQKKLPAE